MPEKLLNKYASVIGHEQTEEEVRVAEAMDVVRQEHVAYVSLSDEQRARAEGVNLQDEPLPSLLKIIIRLINTLENTPFLTHGYMRALELGEEVMKSLPFKQREWLYMRHKVPYLSEASRYGIIPVVEKIKHGMKLRYIDLYDKGQIEEYLSKSVDRLKQACTRKESSSRDRLEVDMELVKSMTMLHIKVWDTQEHQLKEIKNLLKSATALLPPERIQTLFITCLAEEGIRLPLSKLRTHQFECYMTQGREAAIAEKQPEGKEEGSANNASSKAESQHKAGAERQQDNENPAQIISTPSSQPRKVANSQEKGMPEVIDDNTNPTTVDILIKLFAWLKDLPEKIKEQALSSFSMQQVLKTLESSFNPHKLITDQLQCNTIEERFKDEHDKYHGQEGTLSNHQELAHVTEPDSFSRFAEQGSIIELSNGIFIDTLVVGGVFGEQHNILAPCF